ncbi:hypothetical protein ASF82_02315 [Frigoribacterium sp. Leaf164]|uniref:carboxypeptidase-like regulatory domain-containing protein n=1 Tax=Frigoribacterium sp. Leaf164 TaxID=1736282 RepID=UPI0006FD8175|nr:carboxypeptidase-like regulatory domain-containing protein [Frigoribacterium sp. Leaf164]KQR46360.1 hypothetical protein ASF82_02315 [Frigoribacterium sp. Leaf164]
MRAALRRGAAAGTVAVVALGLALAGATTASAAQAGAWGSFTLSGSAREWSGTMSLPGGFPETTFTSTSRQATVPSGSSTWQAASTAPGERYGSSRGLPYLNLRPQLDRPVASAASVTTYTFGSATPSAGWSFVLGDVDADQVTVTATDPAGAAVPASALGFGSAYNYCRVAGGPSCDAAGLGDVPRWDSSTGVLLGNADALDTEGAAAWFSPTVPLGSLTLTFQQRSGFPVFQTWFATRTQSLTGTVTEGGAAFPAAAVTVRDASGTVVAETTTNARGEYVVPALTAAPGWRVTVEPPAGTPAAEDVVVDLTAADGVADVAFPTAPAPAPTSVAVTATIVDTEGTPVPDLPLRLVERASGATVAEVTTADDGTATVADLAPTTSYELFRADTGESLGTLVPNSGGVLPVDFFRPVPAPAPEPTVDVSGTIAGPDGAPAAGATLDVVLVPADGGEPTETVATVETDAAGGFEVDGLLPETDYVIVVDEQAEAAVPFTTPAAGAPATPLVLEVPAPESVSVDGTVVDQDGEPVADAPVAVLPATGDAPVAETTTDADGRFVLDDLDPGTDYRLVVDGDVAGAVPFTTGFADAGLGTVAVTVVVPDPTPGPTPGPSPEPSPGPPAGPAPTASAAPVAPGTTPTVRPAGRPGGLAFTGADAAWPLGLGAALLVAGLGLVTGRAVLRRRQQAVVSGSED